MKKITSTLWRRFETVVSLAIKSILVNTNIGDIQEKITEATHDGGYDGSFLIPYITDIGYSQNEGYYKILFEAKLRQNIDKDLPLQDFSKSLIIAINMDSDALIVATNLRLSDGTKRHLRDFSEKTGLKTYYLSPYYIDTWMENNYSFENETTDSQIRYLLRNSSTYSNLQAPLELLKNESVVLKKDLPQLLGEKRKKLLIQMSNALKVSNGIIIVKGNAGVGKTLFCNHLHAELERNHYSIYTIDLKNYQTPRVLFLKLLEALWHMPFETLMSFDKTSLNTIINELDSHIIDNEIKEAILFAFSKDLEQYSKSADILNYYLIKYLLNVHQIRTRHNDIILFFSNVNCLSSQMIDFIFQFLNEYSKQGKAILELRTSTYIDNQMDSNKWDTYSTQFVSMENILYQDTITQFSRTDAYKYIRLTLNLVNPDTILMDSIIRITGFNPLFLGTLVEYLNITGLITDIPREVVLQKLEYLIVDDKRQIISMLINAFSKKAPFYAELFETIRIFQIPIKEEYIRTLILDYQTDYVDQLIDAKLLIRVDSNLEVMHPLQFECILNTHSLMDFAKRELARKILNTLEEITLSIEDFSIIQIRCYRILNNFQKVIDIEYPLAVIFFENGQYALCYEYAKDAFEKVEIIDSKYKTFIHLKILLLMIEICIYREEESVTEIDDYMEKLNDAIECFPSENKKCSDYIIFKAQYYMTKNRYEHFVGSFEQAFDTLSEALEFVENNRAYLNNQVIGNIQLEYAIALKEKEDLNHSLAYLEKCIEIQPDNSELLFTYHTQMYELYLLTNPELSLQYIVKNRALCVHLSVATTFHNEVHWLNVQYYMKNYDICFTEANVIYKNVEKIGLKNEAGRLANLIGNLYFLKKDFINAKIYYQYGIQLFQEKGYVSNVWALLTNMSTLLTELRDEKAINYIQLSIDILSNSYRERIQKPYPLPGYYEKLQVAVVILYYNIKKNESLLCQETYKKLFDNFSTKLLNDKMQQWLFPLSCEDIICMMKDTKHFHSPYLLLGN